VDLSLNGYHPWSKTLQMLPERVTFANGIVLWLDATPNLLVSGSYRIAVISPNGKYVVAVKRDGDTDRIVTIELSSGKETVAESNESNQAVESFDWSDDSTAILISRLGGEHDVILRRDATKSNQLPNGFYRWENGILIGALDGERYVYDISNDTAQRDRLAQNVKDVLGNYQIISPTSTQTLALIERGGDVRFDLPPGDWRFVNENDGYVYLRNGDHWLSFDPSRQTTSAVRFDSISDLESIKVSGNQELLSRYGGELSMGKPGQDLDLLVRKSDSIVGSSWHESGKYLFYATTHDVIALDLDSRDHRIETVLASFDEITGFTYQKREAFIVGKKGDQQGVWKLLVE
jgi:hypothetical protein